MNKSKLTAMVMWGLIAVSCIGLIFLAQKSKALSRKAKDLSARLEQMNPGYQKLSQDQAVLKDENARLLKENEAFKVDHNNLVAQIKTLLPERNRSVELAASLEKANRDLSVLVKEKNELQNSSVTQKEELARLKAAQKDLVAKWDSLKNSCDKAEQFVKIKELNRKVGDMQKEKTAVANSLKRQENELDQHKSQNTKLGLENASLKAQLKDTKEKLAEAVNKNKKMWEQVQNTPKKVTELARQNRLLIAETAQMHYNLGTFYTRNKQYDRAAVEFQKVIEIDPNNANAQFNLGYIYAEYLVNRQKASKHFRLYLGLAKPEDRDVDWVKKYLLTWEAYDGKTQVQ